MRLKNRAWRRGAVFLVAIIVASCGGGSGGGSDPNYPNVQPPGSPAAEVVVPTQVSGTVSVTADTFDQAGHQAGFVVELHEVLADGSLGPAVASGATSTDGSFGYAMPAGASTADGKWVVVARPAGAVLRGYVYPGSIRVDVSSEAWARQVVAAAGKLVIFPNGATSTLKSLSRSIGLFSDSTGADYAGETLNTAPDKIVQALKGDHGMTYVLSTLGNTGALPATGTGDIGAFYGISETYGGEFIDGSGVTVLATLRSQYSPMTIDGSWSFRQLQFSMVNGQWTQIAGAGFDARLTPDRWYTRLPQSGVGLTHLSNVVGEYPLQSFPLQSGARQLDARRIEHTGLNFTGGTTEQPLSFSSIETVGGVEVLTIAAGQFRTVRVIDDIEIGTPNSDGTVRRITLRSTMWVAPGAGIVKEVDEVLQDGVPIAGVSPETHVMSLGYVNGLVWPNRVSITRNFLQGISDSHRCATPVPGTRRFVTIEPGEPIVNGTSRLALGLWDMDTGAQIGPLRTFAGNSTSCPVAAGQSGSVLVAETFSERNLMSIWPADQATARSYSDVVHQVSASDLSDLASYRIAAVPDPVQPTLYQPAWVDFLSSAPDTSGKFLVGSVMSTYNQTSGTIPQYVQALGPNTASAVSNLGLVLIAGADWSSGQIFTNQNSDPFTLRTTTFSLSGADTASSRIIKTNFRDSSIWYTSTNYIHLTDGSTIRIADGADGPRLPFTANACGTGYGVLVCLDWRNDRLVRHDVDALTLVSTIPLASYLRSLAQVEPDYSSQSFILTLFGIQVWDDSTFKIGGYDVHVGRWQ